MWQKIWQNKLLILFLFIALGSRLYALFQPAQPYDINTYQAWAQLLIEKGPADFFATTWSDYLPLPIYLFAFIGQLSTLLSLPFALVFKAFFTLLELGLIFWLFSVLSKQFPKSSLRYALYALLLSPALIGDTSWWGQTDSLPALLAVISLSYFLKVLSSSSITRLWPSAILFSLAVSFKPIMLLTVPVFLVLYFTHTPRSKLLSALLPTVLALFLFLLPALFINPNPLQAFDFLYEKAAEQANTYPFTTINAFNFWNYRSSLTTWPPDNQIVLGLSAHTLGLILFGLFTLVTLNFWRKHKFAPQYAFRITATILILFYTFTTRMHERHLLFGLPFLALAGMVQPWLFFLYSLLTLLFTFNLWAAYLWVLSNQTWPMPAYLGNLASLLTVVLALVLVFNWHWPKFVQTLKTLISRQRVLIVLFSFGFLLRLVNLSHPPAHIFDEVYHAFTAQVMVQNNPAAWEWWNTPPEGFAYEWTHPPVAKYGMVAGLLLFGDTSFGWRIFSAVFGLLSLAAAYRLLRLLFPGNHLAAYLSIFLLSLEGLHLVQSRVGMNDIYLLAFYLWSLVFALRGNFKKAAILYGLALASKWSALYGLLPLALVYLHQFWPKLKSDFRSTIRYALCATRLVATATITYLLSYTPFFLSGHTWAQLAELHRQMWYYHTHLVATHTYQSTPWQWLLAVRPVWYWVDYGDLTRANIFAQGNPLILWLGLVAFVMLIPRLKRFPYIILYTSYLILFLPWIFSPRIMFYYHYLPSATFLVLILAVWLSEQSLRTRQLLLLLCLLIFLLLSPVYYGFALPTIYWESLFNLFPSWQ